MSFTISLPVLYQLPIKLDKNRLKVRLNVTRGVSLTGEQLLCRRRAVPYQGKEEAEGEKNSIFLDKVATISVCFKPLSNWRGRELYLRL